MQKWRDAYDAAGISCDPPPAELVRLASGAALVITSDLPRAAASARALAPRRPLVFSDLLRETPLAIPRWPTRLPLAAWDVLIHGCWTWRILCGTDVPAADRSRAKTAADWLAATVAGNCTAVVVTHGVFRRILAQQLTADGWISTSRNGGYGYWSCWTLERERAADT